MTRTVLIFLIVALSQTILFANPLDSGHSFKSDLETTNLKFANPCDPILSGNPDSDGDGISDICDLDDDNDGILDTDDCVITGVTTTAGLESAPVLTYSIIQGADFGDSNGNADANTKSVGVDDVVVYRVNDGTQDFYVSLTVLNSNAVSINANVNNRLTVGGTGGGSSAIEWAELGVHFFNLADPDFATASDIADVALIIKGGGGTAITHSTSVDVSDIDLTSTRVEGLRFSALGSYSYTLDDPSEYIATSNSTYVQIDPTVNNPTQFVRVNFLNTSNYSLTLGSSNGGAGYTLDFGQSGSFSNPQTSVLDKDCTMLDTDGDGCFDALEGDGNLTLADLNADGSINVGIPADVDADGVPNIINAGGSADTDGEQGQGVGDGQDASIFAACPSDPPSIDNDNDGIVNSEDLDDDNDGILDATESTCATAQIIWNHNGNSGESDAASYSTGADVYFTTAQDLSFGAGLDESDNISYSYRLRDATATNFADAKAGNDYVEVSFVPGEDMELYSIYLGFYTSSASSINFNCGNFKIALESSIYSTFFNSTLLFEDLQVGDMIAGASVNLSNSISDMNLEGGTQVYFRFYLYDEQNTDPENRVRFDDLSFSVYPISTCDYDGDGLANTMDTDSDNDGCPDALEGDGSISYTQIANDTLTGGVDAQGIPFAATSSGQGTGVSQDSTDAGACIPMITHFDLIETFNQETLRTLNDGDTINFANDGMDLTIEAILSYEIASIRFDLDSIINFQTDNFYPHLILGDSAGIYNPWTPALGWHTLTATAFSENDLSGTALDSLTITFYVEEGCSVEGESCTDGDPCTINDTFDEECNCVGVYQSAADGNTACPFATLDIKVCLEGPYDLVSKKMSTTLQARNLLPDNHPYGIAPWNYFGNEGQGWQQADYPANSVDWVKVSFRTGIEKSTEVASTVAVLQEDGSLVFPDQDALDTSAGSSFYIVVQHRNHMGIMTPQAITVSNGTLSYDFRSENSYEDGMGQKEVDSGVWAMFVGDGDQAIDSFGYDINGSDQVKWKPLNGFFNIYMLYDYNMDGDVNGTDKALWSGNNGVYSAVEK